MDAFQCVVVGLLVVVVGSGILFLKRRYSWSVLLALAALTMCVEVSSSGAVNTARSPRGFATILDGFQLSGDRVVGTVGKSDRSNCQDHGSHALRPVDLREPETHPGEKWPHLIAARKDNPETPAAARSPRNSHGFNTSDLDGVPLPSTRRMPGLEQTAKQEDFPLRFVLVGDTGQKRNEQAPVVRGILKLHEKRPLDAVILLGDNLYGDEPFEYAMRDRFILPFTPLLKQDIPFYAVLGNHDVNSKERREAELNAPQFNMRGRNYYTQEFGEGLITFFMIDSESLEEDPEQLAWLKLELGRCNSQWKVLALHRPIEASELSHGPKETLRKLLTPVITGSKGVDLVFSGHNHFFERRKPVQGVTHITLGAGGEADRRKRFPEDEGREAGYLNGPSFGWIEVRPSRIDFHAVDERGRALDHCVLEKPAPPLASHSDKGVEGAAPEAVPSGSQVR